MNKEVKNTISSEVENADANFLRPAQPKVVKSSFEQRHLSKVEENRHFHNHVKTCSFIRKYSPEQRAVLTSLYLWQFFCKEQTKNRESELFDIQILGLEQIVSLLTKET